MRAFIKSFIVSLFAFVVFAGTAVAQAKSLSHFHILK